MKTKSQETLLGLLAMLKAIHHTLYVAHWTCTDYQQHILFERLYLTLPEQFDTLAEKIVASDGPIPSVKLATLEVLCLKKWEGETNLVAKSLAAEHNLQSVITETYDALKASGDLSFGLDDYLLSLANEHETNLYLLQQNTPKS